MPSLRIPALGTSDQPFPADWWEQKRIQITQMNKKQTITNTLTTSALTETRRLATYYSTPGPLTESEKDTFLVSSQETIKCAHGCTNHSMPLETATSTADTKQITPNTTKNHPPSTHT